MAMAVNKLRPGQAFRIWLGKTQQYIDYRLVHVNECRAYVEPLRKGRTDILEDSPGGRVNISPNCECEIIDEELDELMKTKPVVTPQTTTAAKTKAEKTPRGADRKFDARKQERPVREGTIRAQLLAAIEGGNTDIPKLMKQFDMARSLLIAHVHEMWNCHGYGYAITGDVVKITKPVGGVMKAEPGKKKAATPRKKKGAAADPLADDEEEDPLA